MNAQVAYYESKLAFEIDPFDLFESMNRGERVIPVDTRTQEGFEREHILGAISFPHRTMNIESTKHLDREVLYVAYCDGIGCNGSTKGALKLASLGFKVKELIGGIEWWKIDGYETAGLNGIETAAKVKCAC